MPVKGTRETSSNHLLLTVIIVAVLLVVYMLYTGVYNPFSAINRLLNMLPFNVQGLLSDVMNLFWRLVRELERFLPL